MSKAKSNVPFFLYNEFDPDQKSASIYKNILDYKTLSILLDEITKIKQEDWSKLYKKSLIEYGYGNHGIADLNHLIENKLVDYQPLLEDKFHLIPKILEDFRIELADLLEMHPRKYQNINKIHFFHIQRNYKAEDNYIDWEYSVYDPISRFVIILPLNGSEKNEIIFPWQQKTFSFKENELWIIPSKNTASFMIKNHSDYPLYYLVGSISEKVEETNYDEA